MKFFLTVMLVFFSLSLFAHHVVVFAYVEGDTVITESKYPNGKIVKNGAIKVFSSNGQLLLEGKSGDDGKFSFKIPAEAIKQKSGLNIELYAGEGHKETWELKYAEIAASGNKDQEFTKKQTTEETIGQEFGTSSSMGEKILLGITGIAMIFAVLYYIKRKLKI